MKKLLVVFFCAIIVCTLVSCKQKPATTPVDEPLGITETLQVVSGFGEQLEYSNQVGSVAIKAGYPYVNPYGEDAETYPRLAVALEENYQKLRNEKLDFLSEIKKDADLLSDEAFPYQNSEQAYIRRADTKVLSIVRDCYSFTGGMHGYSFFTTENYDPATGKLLQLSDVITDPEALPAIIWTELDITYPDLPFWDGNFSVSELLTDDRADWTLDYNGITFYFNPYDLTAYAYGRQQLTLQYADFPDLVKKEYQASPVSYGVELPEGCNFYYDVDANGVADTIFWENRGENQGINEKIVITLNGAEYECSAYSFENKATFVKTRTGEFYLYVQNLMENDARETHIFRLGNTVEQTGSMQGGLRTHFYQAQDMNYVQDVLTNPDLFQMSTRTQMASTVMGYRDYTVGENGVPQSLELLWHFEKEDLLCFTALRDFSAEIYDEETHTAKGTIQIIAGEPVHYYATDGAQYIWILLEDGTLCRKEAALVDHRLQIDGYPVEEVFEGIVYAG